MEGWIRHCGLVGGLVLCRSESERERGGTCLCMSSDDKKWILQRTLLEGVSAVA